MTSVFYRTTSVADKFSTQLYLIYKATSNILFKWKTLYQWIRKHELLVLNETRYCAIQFQVIFIEALSGSQNLMKPHENVVDIVVGE